MEKKPHNPTKPPWLKVRAPGGEKYHQIKGMVGKLELATVCEEARCPNISECWRGGTATFMLLGDTCTRGCRFCNVKTGNPKGKVDPFEPEKVGHSIARLDLDYAVITSVDRDDLEDHGAGHFARTIKTVKKLNPKTLVEVLTPDFIGREDLIAEVVHARPDVFAHNVETIRRLSPSVRDPRSGYDQSLEVLRHVKQVDPEMFTKSSIMLGLGEQDNEVLQTLKDLRQNGCDIVTFGQYLQPRKRLLKVEEYITPEKFKEWQTTAENMGFLYVASGPLVRSSYRAGEFYIRGIIDKKNKEKTRSD